MANRFWVGGTGTWDASTTTHWSATTGGAGGASVPGTSDAVFLDGNSGAGTITLGVSPDITGLDCTGYTGTLVGTTFTIQHGGLTANCKFSAAMTLTSVTISWHSTAVGTLTTNGKSLLGVIVGGGSSGGTVTLGDACTVTGAMNLTSGTLNTNGQTCNWGSFTSSNSNTRALTLGASAITVTGGGTAWDCTTSTNLTVTAGTSSITMSGAAANFFGGAGKTYYDLSLTGSSQANVANSSLTFHNLTRLGTAAKNDSLVFGTSGSTTTVTGTFTVTGNSIVNRVAVISPIVGTAVAVNAAAVSLSNADFRDINASGGAAAPWTGSSLGDLQGNTSITFAGGVTRYWVGDSGNWSDTAHWSTTSGGATGASVPLAQDAAVLDANSFSGASKTVTVDMPSLPGIDYSAANKATCLFSLSLAVNIYGQLLGTSLVQMSWTNSQTITLLGRGSYSIGPLWSSGSIPNLTFNAPGGTYTLAGNIAGAVAFGAWFGAVTLTAGTLDLNGFNFNMRTFASTGTAARAFKATGGGSITLNAASANSVWNVTGSGYTFTISAIPITLRQASSGTLTFTGGGCSYGLLTYNVAGSVGALSILDTGNSFSDIAFSDATNARTLTLLSGSTTTLTSTRALANLFGTATKLMTVNASTPGSAATIALPNGVAGGSDFTSVKDITATTNAWWAGSDSTNVSGNTNVIFQTIITAAITMAGTSTLSVSGLQQIPASPAIAGTGTLTVAGRENIPSTVTVAGTGSLAATGQQNIPSTVVLAGVGVLAATGIQQIAAAFSIDGVGGLSVTGQDQISVTAAFTGSGALAAAASVTEVATVLLAGVGALAAAGQQTIPSSIILAGTSALAATGSQQIQSTVLLAGASALAVTGHLAISAASLLTGASTLVVSGSQNVPASPILAGSGALAVGATVQHPGAALLAGAGTLSASAVIAELASIAITGQGTLAAGAVDQIPVSLTLAGAGALLVAAINTIISGSIAFDGHGTLVAAGSVHGPGRDITVTAALSQAAWQATTIPGSWASELSTAAWTTHLEET